jgi:predicted dehydrogenase
MVINGIRTQSGSYGDEILTIAKNRSVAPAATWEDEEKRTYHVDNSWADETQAFIDCVIENQPVLSGNSDHAIEVMRIIDEVYTKERHANPVLHKRLQ